MISFEFSICKFTQNFWIIHRRKEKNIDLQIQLASATKLVEILRLYKTEGDNFPQK